MASNDYQVGGVHYMNMEIQPWDFIASNDLNFLEGSIIKYVSRWRRKDGMADLRKAQHFLEKLIEVEVARVAKAAEKRLAELS